MVGTPLYVSPSVLAGDYDSRCDCWSAGVIMYILLCGNPPFFANCKPELFHAISNEKHNFNDTTWNRISPQAKDLINRLLVKKDKDRITA
jgi:calcium-dependent protein kinase